PNVTLTVRYPLDDAGIPIVGANRTPASIDGYIGVSSTPNETNDSGINFTSAAGNAVEYSQLTDTQFRVLNSTCQFYYARFVVHFRPVDSGASAGDAPPGDAPEGDA